MRTVSEDFWPDGEHIFTGSVNFDWAHIGTPQWNRMFLYLLRSEADELLYVGITWSIKVRWQQHRLKRDWWPEVARAEVYSVDAKDSGWALAAARDIERRCMTEFNPLKNLHGPASLPSKQVPA